MRVKLFSQGVSAPIQSPACGLIAFEMAKAATPSTDIRLTSVDALSHTRKKLPSLLIRELVPED